MVLSSLLNRRRAKWSVVSSFLTCVALVIVVLLTDTQPAYTLPVYNVRAIPAFARKYGLPCSACHTAWPELNYFGMAFRDRGYQLGNDRDSPIWQNPSYWPITARITPNWHRETANHQVTDTETDAKVSQAGFDLSGMDLWMAGTLYKNISFSLLPSSDETGAFHFENAFVRFDNLGGSPWLNLKFGHFELDNLISEKRFLFLSGNGGFYQNFHFLPVGDTNNFGIGDNQTGIELAGHNATSYTRYSVSMLSSSDGGVGYQDGGGNNTTGRSYDWYFTFTKGFPTGSLGVQRIQPFLYYGRRPTIFNQTVGGDVIPATGTGNKSFYRAGFQGDLFLGKFEVLPFYQHSNDNVYLANGIPAGTAILPGMQNAVWNGGFIETHYYWSPQLVLIQRWEIVRMAQQGLATTPGNQGNIDAYSFGYRWYPIMFSRAGLAWHNEYSIVKSIGIVPLSGNGSGLLPFTSTTPVWSSSLMFGFDFDF